MEVGSGDKTLPIIQIRIIHNEFGRSFFGHFPDTVQALCRILGTNCVTCSYIDKFASFHNQMSVFHNIFVKFLQTIYFYKAKSARKIDAQLNLQYTGYLI